MTPVVRAPRRMSGGLAATIYTAGFLDMLGYGIVVPMLPLTAQAAGGSAAVGGLVLGVYSIGEFVAAPRLGRWADRVGRRPVVLWSLAGNALSMALLGVAAAWAIWPLLVLARLVAGIAAGNLTTLQLVIADTSSESERTGRLGRFGAAIGLGIVVGPALGGLLGQVGPWAPAAGAGAIAVAALAMAMVMLPETRPAATSDPRHETAAPPDPGPPRDDHHRVLALVFTAYFCLTGLQAFFPLYAEVELGWGPSAIGGAFSLYGLVQLAVQGGLVGPLARRVDAARLVVAGPALTALGMAIPALGHGSAAAVAGLCVIAGGMSLTSPLATTLTTRLSPPEHVGLAIGRQQSAATLGRALGPLLGGALFAAAGSAMSLAVCAALAAASAVAILGVRKP